MKRFFCVVLVFCLLCVYPVSVNGEEASVTEDKELNPTDVASPGWKPEYNSINNINVTFYIVNGKAVVSYLVASSVKGIKVSIQLYKGRIFQQKIGDVHENYTDKKYLSGQCVVPVNESGYYCVTVKVTSGEDNAVKNVSYTYDTTVLMGDVDADGYIRAKDARKILRYSAKLENYSPMILSIGDVDGNGVVTAADARIVLRLAAKLF